MTTTTIAQPRSGLSGTASAYLSLFLISAAAASSYFAYDVVSPLGDILERDLSLTSSQVNMLYSIYSIPVIFLVVFGGVLADRLGVRRASLLFTGLFTLGAFLTAVGNFPMMLVGRLVFGIGAECFYVVMNKVMAKWFKNRSLALAFGLNLFLCRAGTYLAFFGLPQMVEMMESWRLVMLVAAGITAVAVPLMFLYSILDRRGERLGFTALEEEPEAFHFSEILRLPRAFWLISLLCLVYYASIFPFTAIAPRFFQERYGMDREAAGSLTGLLTLISMCSTWFFGLLVDRFGRRAIMMIVGSLLMIPCHLSMAITDINPLIPMVVLGLSFSLVPAALWPAIPLLVRGELLGTAFGVTAMMQNVGLFLFPLAAGALRDTQGNYTGAMLMFSAMSVLGVVLAVMLRRAEGVLDAQRRG